MTDEPSIEDLCKPLSAKVTPDRCKLDAFGRPQTRDSTEVAWIAKQINRRRRAAMKRKAEGG